MARLRSPEKRRAILHAAVLEIAETGLGASTANIAKRARIAAGTLFTYFPTKEDLFNQLYLDLKVEVYATLNADFPHNAALERRVRHVWQRFLAWALEFPAQRKVSLQLNVSHLITPETRAKTAILGGPVQATLLELDRRAGMRGLPAGFAASFMAALQDATMEFVARQPKRAARLIENAFQVFWRAVR